MTVIVRFKCIACGKIKDYENNLRPGQDLYLDSLPSDDKGYWWRYFEAWICSDHKIETALIIDGKRVALIPNDAVFPGPSLITYEEPA